MCNMGSHGCNLVPRVLRLSQREATAGNMSAFAGYGCRKIWSTHKKNWIIDKWFSSAVLKLISNNIHEKKSKEITTVRFGNVILIIIHLVSICFEFLQGLFMAWQACKSVSSDFQTPQSWWKKTQLCLVFFKPLNYQCLEIGSNTLPSVWHKLSHHMQQNCTI